jgi:hypothetical protein
MFCSAFSSRPALIAAFLCASALLTPMTPAVAAKATTGNAAAPSAAGHPTAQPHPAAPSGSPSAPSSASTCAKPPAPQCMDDGATFAAPDTMTGCQSEVKDYVDRTMSYLKCLNDENIAAGRDLTRNVERFNCRLSGRKGCP